jgi:hypothetical protein
MGPVMEGQTVASMNAAAGKPEPKPAPPGKGEQLEISVTFVLPAPSGGEDFQEVYSAFAEKLSTATTGFRLLGGSSFEMRHRGWFLSKIVHRVGKRSSLSLDYYRPRTPRR